MKHGPSADAFWALCSSYHLSDPAGKEKKKYFLANAAIYYSLFAYAHEQDLQVLVWIVVGECSEPLVSKPRASKRAAEEFCERGARETLE